MRYFVIADDGQKYGPADVSTLQSWVAENRLLPNQMLEEESSGLRVVASSVQGLSFPMAAPMGAPGENPQQPYQGYYNRPGAAAMVGDGGKSDMNQAWIFSILSLCCCPPLFVWLALNAAKRAEEKGANAQGPRIVAYIGLALFVIGIIFQVIALATGAGR